MLRAFFLSYAVACGERSRTMQLCSFAVGFQIIKFFAALDNNILTVT